MPETSESGELDQVIEGKVTEAIKANNAELLESIGTMINKISAASTSTAPALLEIPKFKRKSNEEQFKQNSKILEKLDEAERGIISNRTEQVKDSITAARDMLKHRQKLIQLADSSELGWRIVAEYEQNPIASDSEDEKRIYKAEARATRKAKSEKVKKSKARTQQPYSRRNSGWNDNQQNAGGARGGYNQGQRAKPGSCFICGKAGHWKNECPQQQQQQQAYSNNKISTACECNDMAKHSFQVINYNPNKESQSETIAESRTGNTYAEKIKPEVSVCMTPRGRLKKCIGKWKEVSDNQYILQVVEEGYKIPFKSIPSTAHLRNNKSARDNSGFVEKEIDSLLKKDIVSEVKEKPQVVNPLTVAYNKSGKPRLVLDCRHINPCLHLFKIKFEDISTAERMFDMSSYLYTFDLKSAYHHIDIFPEHSTYLGFSWSGRGVCKFYVYNQLPFGIATAGHIFTKTLRVIVQYFRSKSHKVIMFLDDGIGGNADQSKDLESSTFVRQSLKEFGFLLAEDKCNWVPSQIAKWLGHTVDMGRNCLFISEERIARLEVALDSALLQLRRDKCSVLRVRFLAGVVGQIISLQSVIGRKVCLKTKFMSRCILNRLGWNSFVHVDEDAKGELSFWRENAREMNRTGKSFQVNCKTVEASIYVDASAVGYGGYIDTQESVGTEVTEMDLLNMSNSDIRMLPEVSMGSKPSEEAVTLPEVSLDLKPCEEAGTLPDVSGLSDLTRIDAWCIQINEVDSSKFNMTDGKGQIENGKDNEVCGSWSTEEMGKSSTWRELEAVHRVLLSCIDKLKGKHIRIYTDNKNVTYILSKGSNTQELHRICINIHNVCEKNGITFTVEWIPRDQNDRADHLSRCLDSDDWSIKQELYDDLNRMWGPHSVDRFASHYNTHCARFNSRWWTPNTEGIDALEQYWGNDVNWLVPPPRLIPNAIKKMELERAVGTLVVPKWVGAPFWPLIINERGEYNTFVKDVHVVPVSDAVRRGRGNNGVGIKDTIKQQLDDAGGNIENQDEIVDRMATHVLGARAGSTVNKYTEQVRAFKDFCNSRSISYNPAFSIHVAMYLSNLIDSGKSYSMITAAFYAIKWLHNINDQSDPTENSIVKNILECAKRTNSKPVVKKDVVTRDHLVNLCEVYSDSTDVIALRDLCMILLSFAGFLRFSELSELKAIDVDFKSDHLVLKIRKSKTDVYRAGREVLISKGESAACPYSMLKRYIDAAGIIMKSDLYLFKPACRSKGACFLLNKNKKLSYTRARECIVTKLREVAPDMKLGTHSLRASGATTAANAEGVSDRCLKRHGRWKSDTAKDGYIDDSVEKKLFITKQLKL